MESFYKILENYLKRKDTDYAIHVNGNWGSGKTYFLKNDVRQHLEKKDGEWQIIYISLNGIRTLEEISDKVFMEVISLIKFSNQGKGINTGKVISTTTSLLKNINSINIGGLGVGASMDLAESINKVQEYINNNIKRNILLCFDDLERIDDELPLKSVLGLILCQETRHV
ncbi:P-loop NTPase fold protein [Alkalicoccus saliphilus]|uniref:KAP NTPase domain-containing protein n=1 Tax=Alkalicoccus saliphilus TaxID=200989 RepID=A0A2T4U4P3_9BACI|nr:P-loop NTPase fold protein [Alkalicoccus saliphilus]PTL38363.1 hypothetical protein C6Y45_11420 [Alkalicoccus saliphilus]